MDSESLHKPFDADENLAFALTVVEGLADYARAEHLTEADELLAQILALLLDNRSCSHRPN